MIFVLAYAYFNACVFAHLFSILQIIFFFQFFVTWMYVWSIVAPWQFCGPPSTPLIPLTGESKWFRDFFMLDAERPKANAGYFKIVFCSIFISNDCHLMFWLNRIFHQISYKLNILYAKYNMLQYFLPMKITWPPFPPSPPSGPANSTRGIFINDIQPSPPSPP